jgi:hypothetical protein
MGNPIVGAHLRVRPGPMGNPIVGAHLRVRPGPMGNPIVGAHLRVRPCLGLFVQGGHVGPPLRGILIRAKFRADT